MSAAEIVREFDPNAPMPIPLAERAAKRRPPMPARTSTNVIMATAFEPIRWIVPG